MTTVCRGTAAACNPADLHVLAYAAGFTLWHYRTEVSLDDIARPGFFDPARALLRPGDRIAVNVRHAGRFAAARDFCVLADRPTGIIVEAIGAAAIAP